MQHGLSVAIAFGGRPNVGEGFGIGLVVRYLLEFTRDVPEAIDALRRVPVQLSYNVALVDRLVTAQSSTSHPIVNLWSATTLSRPTVKGRPNGRPTLHSAQQSLAKKRCTRCWRGPASLPLNSLSSFSWPPIYRPTAASTWGTVYTAVYDCDARTLQLALAR